MAQNVDEHCEGGRHTILTSNIVLDESVTQNQIRTVDVAHARKLLASFDHPCDLLEVTVWDATRDGVTSGVLPIRGEKYVCLSGQHTLSALSSL